MCVYCLRAHVGSGDLRMANDRDKRRKQVQSTREWLRRHKIMASVVGVLLVLVIIISTSMAVTPVRSKVAFCQLIEKNKSQLVSLDVSYQEKLDIYKKLEQVAPEDRRDDMQRIVGGYQSIVNSPETAMATEFGIMGEMRRFNDYMNNDCTEK